MKIALGLNMDVDDGGSDKEEIVLELIEVEFRKFSAQVMDVLEQHGMTDIEIVSYDEDAA